MIVAIAIGVIAVLLSHESGYANGKRRGRAIGYEQGWLDRHEDRRQAP